MEWFKNLKISIKLFLSFALIIGLMAVQSWVGHRKVTVVHGELEQLFSSRLPTLDGLLQVDRDLQQLRVAERSLLQVAPTDPHFEPLLRAYEENLQQAARRWSAIRPMFASEEFQGLAARYDAAQRAWQPVSRQVIDLCRQGTPEARAKGLALSLGNAGKLFETMRGYIDSLTELTEAAAAKDAETARRISGATLLQMLAMLAVGILAAGIIGRVLYRIIVGPLRQALQMADEMAGGDLSHRLHLAQDDETGRLCRRLDDLADGLAAHADLAERIAQGDLDVRVQLASDKDQFGKALQHMTDQFNELVGRVQVAVEQISSGSAQVSDASQTLSQGSTESAASMEEITASMTEMASQTKLSAQNADQANSLSKGSRGAAQRGDALMKELVVAMGEIDRAGQDINKIIKVIDEIAFQTNLLALNAAVEAARAGQHGKGFAVVAEEVRSLAARSAKAAKETAQLIEDSAEKTRNGSEIADKTAAALKGIVAGAAKVSDLVAEIAAAANEQAAGFEQVNQGLGQIDQVTQQNTANAEETAAASEELSGQAMVLKEMIGRYKVRGGMAATGKPVTASPARLSAPEPKEGQPPVRLPAPQPKKETVSARPAPAQIGQGAVKSAGPAPRKPAVAAKPAAPVHAVETENPPVPTGEPSKETVSELRPEEIIALDDSEFGRY